MFLQYNISYGIGIMQGELKNEHAPVRRGASVPAADCRTANKFKPFLNYVSCRCNFTAHCPSKEGIL